MQHLGVEEVIAQDSAAGLFQSCVSPPLQEQTVTNHYNLYYLKSFNVFTIITFYIVMTFICNHLHMWAVCV